MGRKIPGKKHRTVKDPNVQKNNRLTVLKNKINNPPGKGDIQEMPKSVLRIMELKQKAKESSVAWKKKKNMRRLERKAMGKMERKEAGKVVKKPIKTRSRFDMKRAVGSEVKLPGMEKPDRFIPDLTQRKRENLYKFARRVNAVCDDVIKEVTFEEKFGVEVKRNEQTGKITEIKQIKTNKRSKKPKLCDKRKERELKKLNAIEPEKEFSKRETFEFGDIVHEPPTNLTLPGRKKREEVDLGAKAKPGKRDLLLKNVLTGEKNVETAKKKPSALEKQKLEARRKLVVEAFRKSKKAKLN